MQMVTITALKALLHDVTLPFSPSFSSLLTASNPVLWLFGTVSISSKLTYCYITSYFAYRVSFFPNVPAQLSIFKTHFLRLTVLSRCIR